ncbi:MAG: hypothetical protein Q4B16_05720 [Bacteroidia bacterium]|nr:hypothetical protein [Bacteroidia bacterium]
MNIIVRTAEGKYIVRPDTTWERDNENLYVPEFVTRLSWTPVLFARISRPGRSVGPEFAERYYDGAAYGVLLYPDDLLDGSEAGLACASCLDHTSFLPFPVSDKTAAFSPESRFELRLEFKKEDAGPEPSRESQVLFSHSGASPEDIRKAIAEATRAIFIRTGDIIALELRPRRPLCSADPSAQYPACGRASLKGSFCGKETVDFDIIF